MCSLLQWQPRALRFSEVIARKWAMRNVLELLLITAIIIAVMKRILSAGRRSSQPSPGRRTSHWKFLTPRDLNVVN